MRASRGAGIALLVAAQTTLWLLVAMPASAQRVTPSWSAAAADPIRWVGGDTAHVITLAGGRIERRRIEDGTLVAQQALAGCQLASVASRGQELSALDPVAEPGPGGLVVTCFGSDGTSEVHLVAALDPITLAVRWRVDGGARSFSAVAERDGRVIVRWEESQGEMGALAVDVATGQTLWMVTLPRLAAWERLLVGEGVVLQVSSAGAVNAVAADDGHTLWATSAAGDAQAPASFRAGVLVTVRDGAVVGVAARDGRVLWRWEAPTRVDAVVPAGDEFVLVQTSEVGGGPVGTVHAIERSSGAARWSVPVGHVVSVVVGRDHAFASSWTEVLSIGLRAGTIERRWPSVEARLVGADGGAVVGIERVGRAPPALQAARVVRFDTATGAAWRSRGRVAAESPVIERGGVVAACTHGGTLRSFEASSGSLRWSSAIGLPRVRVCELTAVGDRIVAVGADDRLSVFDAAGSGHRAPRVVVRGRVEGHGAGAGLRVLVGDAWTRTDTRGRFEQTVHSAGPITIQIDQADDERRCARAERVQVTPASARRREVVLRLRRDPCACHPCD